MMNLAEKLSPFKQQKLHGRYVTNKHIEPIINQLSKQFLVNTIGFSVKAKPIYSVQIGIGKTKILMWSQMHGNESTTTKSLFDLFEYLESNDDQAVFIKNNYTLLCIPILNPDGAEAYTRENANEIDLNRDAIDLSQPESHVLLNIFNDFKPNFCFNLHDQRTIYGVGDTNKPATVSFLAPAYNDARAVNHIRQKAMDVIAIINNELQQYIPNQVGRFDDTYNGNCVGDTFQSLGVPTILFESGHFQGDYEREETRKYIFIAMVCGIVNCSENEIVLDNKANYLNIPQNKMSFNDFIYRNIRINANSLNIITNFAAQYTEVLIEDEIVFEAYISEIGDLENCFGHIEYDGLNETYSDNSDNYPQIDAKADFYLNKNIKFVNGLKIM
jgi:Zinc carboxypeptidase